MSKKAVHKALTEEEWGFVQEVLSTVLERDLVSIPLEHIRLVLEKLDAQDSRLTQVTRLSNDDRQRLIDGTELLYDCYDGATHPEVEAVNDLWEKLAGSETVYLK